MIVEKKNTGSYYTPRILSKFLVDHIFSKYLSKKRRNLSVLEPSCGDGEFVEPLIPHISRSGVDLDLVEINQEELIKATSKLNNSNSLNYETWNMDFLDFSFTKKYSLVLGNPPYISKKYLSEDQIYKCKKICSSNITGEVKNIWPTFLIKSIQNLREDGIVCFVLPSELLQVKYTRGLRKLILESFDRVEIFAFNELVFDNVEQDVVAIIGVKRHKVKGEKGVSFYQVDRLEDLKIPDYIEMNFNVHRERLDKWTNYILDDLQLSKVDQVCQHINLKPISHYADKAEVGIVTAANSYFIKPHSFIKKRKLTNYSKPILQKSTVLKKTLSITESFINELQVSDYAVNLISFRNESKKKHSMHARDYIKEGESLELNLRYKMQKRNNWYHVPSVWSSEAIFSKRSHEYPRMFLNQSNALVTDSFYRVVCREGVHAKNLVFSFYNSLTLVLAELEGRFYGGGVLELIPSEFKSLLIPYNEEITEFQYKHLENLVSNGATIDKILSFTDPILLKDIPISDVQILREIRHTLFSRRTKVQNSTYKVTLAEAI